MFLCTFCIKSFRCIYLEVVSRINCTVDDILCYPSPPKNVIDTKELANLEGVMTGRQLPTLVNIVTAWWRYERQNGGVAYTMSFSSNFIIKIKRKDCFVLLKITGFQKSIKSANLSFISVYQQFSNYRDNFEDKD